MRDLFVGRASELAAMERLLRDDGSLVHAVHAPGGVGKTTLARAFRRRAREAGFSTAWVDAEVAIETARDIEDAWRRELDIGSGDELPDRTVLFIDGFERVVGLESWLRDFLLRPRSSEARLVVCGRTPPSPQWTTSPEWVGRIAVTRLESWGEPLARRYLELRGVEAAEHDRAVATAHGHPLALALLADVGPDDDGRLPELSLGEHPSLVSYLVGRLCGAIDDPIRRTALAVAAHARVTTQSLLEAVVPIDDGFDLFQWLRGLTFVREHPRGLVPHELVRDLLRYEGDWRDPQRARALTARIREHYAAAFAASSERAGDLDALRDLAFVHRQHPMARDLFAFEPRRTLWPELARDDDVPVVEAMLREHGLAGLVDIVRYWYGRQPDALTVIRDRRGEVLGAELAVRVTDEVLAEAGGHDPAAPRVRAMLRARTPLRGDEFAVVARVWCTRAGQVVGDAQSQLWINRVRDSIRSKGIAHLVAYFTEPESFAPAFRYMGFQRVPEADVATESEQQGAFVRDWRHEPAAEWFARMAQQATGMVAPLTRPVVEDAAVVLGRDAFADAVKQALRVYPSRAELSKSPLARSRLVLERVDGGEPGAAEILAGLLEESCDDVRLNPSMKKAYRALYRTVVSPAATQREAATLESMPFGTFRRHLAAGITAVTERLWALETEPR